MNVFDNNQNWKFAAIGKHPVAKDFITLGDSIPFVDNLSGLMESAYNTLTAQSSTSPEFSSWRFWLKGSGKNSLICGIVRESADSLGRPYPFLIIGSGYLKDWEEQWDLLPFACENTWCQFEYLATHTFENVEKLKADVANIRPPASDWTEHAATRKKLNEIGSPLDPYASFLDIKHLTEQASGLADKPEIFISLDRGPANDKILQVSLWHHLFKATVKTAPKALFLGGTLEKGFLAAFNRSLEAADFVQLWSVSSPGLWKNAIGTEYSMDLSMLGKETIFADRATGSDVRYDPAFQEMQFEVDKLSSPSAFGLVDWEKIVRFGSDILAHKSKDLLVATYLAVALIYTRQHDGLSIGVKLLLDLMGKFWDDLYPPKERMRGRLRSMEWWAEKSEIAIRQLPQASIPAAQATLLKEHIDQIEQFMRQHLEGPPSLNAMKTFVNSLDVKKEEKFQEELFKPVVQQVVVAEANHVRKETLQETPVPEEIKSPQSAHRMLDSNFLKMREIVSYFWQQDLANPLVYRINRISIWSNIEDLPPATNGRTRIPAPDNQVMKMLFDLRNAADAEALLKAAEGRLSQFIFWLDLNRFVAEALTRLDNRYQKAHKVVCQETAFLLYQFPGLEELSFADGTPFASPETKNWLKTITFNSSVETQTQPDLEKDSLRSEERIAREVAEAHARIKKGKLLEAMESLQNKLNNTSSRREKVLWRLAIAQLLVNVKQVKLALPHLEQIIREIDTFSLEEYDPVLALKGLKLAWTGLESQNEETFKNKAAEVLYRIARIDMAEVIRLEKS